MGILMDRAADGDVDAALAILKLGDAGRADSQRTEPSGERADR
jgi:hypothetical protein